MVDTHPFRTFLPPQTPAFDWIQTPADLQEFWSHAGNLKGIKQSISSRANGINMTRRAEVVSAIRTQYAEAGLPIPAGLARLEKGAQAITVGHQLQAGGGPGYFHYKILSAIRWARQLEESGTPAVPVFWMASEDHDFEEIAETHGLEGDGFIWNPERVQRAAVGGLTWDDQAESSWTSWANRQGFEAAPSPVPCTLSIRMRHWLVEWFPEGELVVIDGNDALLKGLAASLWTAEWEGQGIEKSLQEGHERFADRWSNPPLKVKRNNLFVLEDNGCRTRADRWEAGKPVGSWKKLRPEQMSPNAALRPVYQEFLLESAGFIGGPSEIAYWLMLGTCFAFHGVHQPALILRDGALVLPAKAASVVKALNWTVPLGWWNGQEATNQWVSQRMPSNGELVTAFDAWSEALVEHANGIPGEAVPLTLAALKRMEKEWRQVEKKWRKIWKLQHAAEIRSVEHAFDQIILPHGVPQERRLSALALGVHVGGWRALKEKWCEEHSGKDEPRFLVFRGEN